ncbi:hypothetical protein [Streptomyces sp. NRRL F-5123]|uniref:hypothetical protein n=1 Tax=Streptomyces sp. NRRL F-5123 TaxID=1463856 RepID=UPI000694F3A8|nr:hypothetical protein [Streptomyces sp. NRRL F-5123]
MTWTPTTALRAGASVAVLASGALLLAACSSSGGSGSSDAKGTTSASASSTASGAADMAAYRDCLAKNGVQLPSFSPGAGRPSGRPSGMPSGRPTDGKGFRGGFPGFGGASADPKTQKAMQACESLRPQFNRGAGGADSSAFAAFTSCLKDHGVTLPTSSASPGANGRRGGMLGGLNTSDPKTAKAYTTCKALLPSRPTPSAT